MAPARRLANKISSRCPFSAWNGCVTTTKPKRSLDDAALCRLRGNGKRPLLARRCTRLGNIDPARGQRAVAALLQLAGQLAEQPVYPVLLDAARVILSMPGAPLLLRTAAHARRKTSLRRTLSYSGWNLRPGSALAARYSACCKARTGSPVTGDPFAAGLASTDDTHRAPPLHHAHRRSSGPSHHRRLCCPAAQPVLRPPPTPTRPAIHFPGSPVIGRHAPVTQSAGHRAGEGLPSSRRHPRYVPRPIRRGVLHGCASRLFAASMAFAPISRGSALPCPAQGRMSNDAAGFASCYGPHRRSPIRAFDAGLRPGPFPDRAASLLPGLLAATRTGLSPAGDDELTNTKKYHDITSRCHLPFCWAHKKTSLREFVPYK